MTSATESLARLDLKYNPFPPATTGVAFIDEVSIPLSWEQSLNQMIDNLSTSVGDKALVIVGGYGSGKTFILNWLARKVLPPRRIQPYSFDNPGVTFYDLANQLLRQFGRYELSKALWEILYRPEAEDTTQMQLFRLEFPQFLETLGNRRNRERAISSLSASMRATGLTTDEEIANKFARVIVETKERPYYDYRDFVPRSRSSLVAEREEASYFRTLIQVLLRILEAQGIAFLIDEFEDVALGRRLNRRQSSEYIATMRRLLDTAREENFWLILSMTPEGFDQTTGLDPSLIERFAYKYEIPPLSPDDARQMVVERLKSARTETRGDLWPFPEEALSTLKPTTLSSPRRLIRVLWQALASSIEIDDRPPLTLEKLQKAEQLSYPGGTEA